MDGDKAPAKDGSKEEAADGAVGTNRLVGALVAADRGGGSSSSSSISLNN